MVSRCSGCCKCLSVSGVLGVVILVTGCVLISVFTNLIHSEIDDQIPLKVGSESYKNWISPPAPIYFQVWMYDVVNHLEVLQGEKPALVQKGPYTYREKRQKEQIVFHDNGTVFYRETRTFFFDRKRSVGPEEETFHNLNLPMMTVLNMVKNEYQILKTIVDAALKLTGETLFMKLSVKDLMWGYDDPLLSTISRLAKDAGFNISLPDKFGLFYGQNGTDDGLYQVYSGQESTVDHFGEIITWNGETQLNTWTSAIANGINGSDGTIYPPFIDTSTTKYLFSSDLCRSLGMEHIGGVKERDIPLERFVAPPILFGNVTVNPNNAGFCTPAGNCLPSGLLNVSSCREGAPIVMSMPNFLGCDPDVIDSVIGMHPDTEEHQSYLDIEPMTGVVMNAGKKLQINVVLEKIDGFPELKNIKKRIYFPVMWLNESAMIDEKDANKFKSEVLDMIKLTDAVKYGLIAIGAFILLLVIGFFVRMKMHQSVPLTNIFSIQQDPEEERLLNGNSPAQYQPPNENGHTVVA